MSSNVLNLLLIMYFNFLNGGIFTSNWLFYCVLLLSNIRILPASLSHSDNGGRWTLGGGSTTPLRVDSLKRKKTEAVGTNWNRVKQCLDSSTSRNLWKLGVAARAGSTELQRKMWKNCSEKAANYYRWALNLSSVLFLTDVASPVPLSLTRGYD